MVMSVRATVDKKTNENVVYVTVYDLGNRNANGVIFSAKSGEAVKIAFANDFYTVFYTFYTFNATAWTSPKRYAYI